MGISNTTKEINYTLDEDVVFFGEAENICTAQSNGYTKSNERVLSSGGGKYAQKNGSGYITLTFNAPSAGVYDIKVGMNNTSDKSRGFNYSLDGSANSSTINVDATSPYVLVISNQYLAAGDHTITLNITSMLTPVFDYVFVYKDYVFTEIVGATDKSTTDRNAKSDDVVLKNGDVYNIQFFNYGSDSANKNNFIVLVNNAASMYADWYDYIQDKGGWSADGGFVNPSLSVTNPYQMSTNGGSTSGNLDWANYGYIRNSFVDLTIKYKDGKVTVEGTATSVENSNYIYYYGYSYTVADATEDATVNLSVCLSWLGIVSEEQTHVGVSVTSAGWATLYTPYALDFSGVEGLTAYTATLEGSEVTLTKVNNVPANTGVVLKGAANTYDIPVIASSSTPQGSLQGSATESTNANAAPDGKAYYILTKSGKDAEFQAASGTIAAGKAYLVADWTSGGTAKSLRVVVDGQTTDVTAPEVVETEEEEVLYNMAGIQVDKNFKGVVINQKGVKRFNR